MLGNVAALRLFHHTAKVHGIQLVDGVLHQCCDDVCGLGIHDGILAVIQPAANTHFWVKLIVSRPSTSTKAYEAYVEYWNAKLRSEPA